MLRLLALGSVAALASAALSDFELSNLSDRGFSTDQIEAIKAVNDRARRKAHGDCKAADPSIASTDDGLLVSVGNCDKVGMQIGDEVTWFNDFTPDLLNTNAANINSMAEGVSIGKAAAAQHTQAIMHEAAQLPALQLGVDQAALNAALKQQIADRVANQKFRLKQLESRCKTGLEYEISPATGSTEDDFKAPLCGKITACADDEFEQVAPSAVTDRVCSKLTVCADGEYAALAATQYSDRICAPVKVCADGEYIKAAATDSEDTVCAPITKCQGAQAESKPPTKTSDRVCQDVAVDCMDFRGGGDKEREVRARDGSGTLVKVMCRNDGSTMGGDGATAKTAGKTCGTIRRWYKAEKSGKYWIFMDDPNDPVEVWCDMLSCGNDAIGLGWGSKVKDYAKCGGWAMAVKIAGTDVCSNNNDGTKGCWYFNRNNEVNWRYGKLHGDKCTDEKPVHAMGPAYNRHEFSDIMMRTIEARVKSSPWRRSKDHANRPWQSVAWRHPWVKKSVRAVAQACRPLQDGIPLHPAGNVFDRGQMHHMFARGINWESRSESQHHFPSNPRNKWGFFLHDGGGCANNRKVVGCDFEWSGHARNFIGYGLDETNDSAFRGGGWGSRITSFGMGSGYCGADGGYGSRDRYSMTGHWWGHGASNMQARSTALFVRNKFDMEDVPFA